MKSIRLFSFFLWAGFALQVSAAEAPDLCCAGYDSHGNCTSWANCEMATPENVAFQSDTELAERWRCGGNNKCCNESNVCIGDLCCHDNNVGARCCIY